MQQLKPRNRSRITPRAFAALAAVLGIGMAQAGYLIEIDTDAADDGILTYNSHFSFGGDTTAASQSSPSPAFGMTGGDSIFGGDAVSGPDTYIYTYDPGTDADNLVIPLGTDLGLDLVASGITGGAPGLYAVFTTWPSTANVTGGLTTFTVDTEGDTFSVSLDQNGKGSEWYKLGEIYWNGGSTPITVTQESGANTFVSMRAAGVLFEPVAVPEPSSFALGVLGALALGVGSRRRRR
ncbi:MAG: hypothetical protein H7A46_18150 [Verrucomicrobiales bacterium]|nr:hypothetical protein [Verrucomicrobiales bacterium]